MLKRDWRKGVLGGVGGVRGRSQLEAMAMRAEVEQLEQRVLLDAVQPDDRYATTMINWRGDQLEVVRDSWVLTFHNEGSRQVAANRAQALAAFFGAQAERVDTSALGRFAGVVVRAQITEATAAAAVQHFGWLRQMQPNRVSAPAAVPNDARYSEQWAHNNTGQLAGGIAGITGADIRSEQAWNITTGNDRVVIAVVDTGVDMTHPDLAANIWRNPLEIPGNGIDDDGNGFIDDVNGWDFASDQPAGQDNDPSDPETQGHGTAVAGVIGAVGGNGIGVAGVNWNVSIIPIKIFPNQGGAPLMSILNGVDYLTMLRRNYGVQIVASNHSYGLLDDDDATQFDDAQEISIRAHTDAGILFVAGAGNDSNDNNGPVFFYPATYPNNRIISAAATNNRDELAGFSNFGSTSVHVGAPGVQVITTEVGGGYQYIDGTSFASPYTAGVIGLMASVNPYANADQLRAAMFATVDVIPGLIGRVSTNGRINAFRAVQAIGVDGPLVTAIQPGPVTATVGEIVVQFSEDINPAFLFPGGTLDASKIILRASNGDNFFDGNDIFLPIVHGDVTLTGSILRIVISTGALPRDAYRLRLVHTGFRDFDGNFLNGDTVNGNDEIYDFSVVPFRGPLEPNDTIATATPIILNPAGRAEFFDLFIGDGLTELMDVDIFRVFVTGPALITAEVLARSLPAPSSLDAYLRLFDAGGIELRANDNFNGLDPKLQYFVPAGGSYYIGVSAFPNRNYNPNAAGSGIIGETTGLYNIVIDVQTAESQTFTASNTTPAPIPHLGAIESTIFIPDGRSIIDVNVRLNVQHSYVGDLRVSLTGPLGQQVILVNRRGGSGQNFVNTVFDSENGLPIAAGAAPFTGTWRPEQTLTVFNNLSALGNWTLRIEDLRTGDAGQLENWSLIFRVSNNLFGPFELNDTLLLATNLDIQGTGSRTVDAFIGDGAFGLRDVDLFFVNAGAGTTITATATPTSGQLDTVIRIFNALGEQVAADKRKGSRSSITSFLAIDAGVYYVAVSGGNETEEGNFGNDAYDPTAGGSGTNTDATGNYKLTVAVSGGISETQVRLSGNAIATGINSDGTIGLYGVGQANPIGLRLGGADFILGGSTIESFYGASFDGFIIRNAGTAIQSDLAVSVSNESDFSNRRALVTGQFRDSIAIRRAVSFGLNDAFIAVDVTITNHGLFPINDAAWVEGFNPSQGFLLTGDDRTVNNVDNATGRLATSTFDNGLTVGMGAAAQSGVFLSFETPGSIRDPYQVINSPFDPDSAGDAGVNGDLSMALAMNLGTIDGNASRSFRYFIFMGATPAAVAAQFALLDSGNGTGHLVAQPLDPSLGAADLPYTLYYPEGFASANNSTFIPIVNANGAPVRVVVIARYEGSAAPDVLFDSAVDKAIGHIAANKRDGITVTTPELYAQGTSTRVKSQIAGRNGVLKQTPYAIEIRSSLPVGATLSHYDFNISTGEAFTSTLSSIWTFGAGLKDAGVQDAVVFYNPHDELIKVTLTLYRPNGSTIVSQRNVPPQRRGGWLLRDFPQLGNGEAVGVRVEGELPIIAALTHFDAARGNGYGTLGTPSIGELRGATPEGQVGVGAAEEFVGILNAGGLPATVTLTFSFTNGSAYRRQVVVGAGVRSTVAVATLPGFPVGQAYAVSYVSNRPVSVTLPSRSNGEETGSAFASLASTQWLFSEGFRRITNNTSSDYLRVYNPTAFDATVAITLSFNNGETETFLRNVSPRAANTFNLHDFITGARRTVGTAVGFGSFFGVRVRSSVPIVAYQGHFDSGLGGGFGTLGTPLGTTGMPA